MRPLKLYYLHFSQGSIKKALRVGRGNSARKGNKCGKGSNGNQQRSGYKRKWGFEGGQTPLNRRIPIQHHINNFRRDKTITVTVDMLSKVFDLDIDEVSKEVLVKNRIIHKNSSYKIVKGKKNIIPEGFKICADAFSEGAKKIIESSKSTCVLTTQD